MAPSQQSQSASAGSVALRPVPTPHLVRLLGDWRGGERGRAYPELAAALRALVVDGRLPPHTRLPSERALATALGVSRNTATAALDVLREEGHLASQRGRGSWVVARPAATARPDEARPPTADVIDLTLANLPAPQQLSALAAAAAAALPKELGGHGYEPFGLPATRAAVAAHLTARGLTTEPDQILITQGALHAWDLALRTFARAGDRIVLETPTYPGALDAVRAHGCVPVGVPVGPDGWDLPMLRAALRSTTPALAYLIPDFQNPTGSLASPEARAAAAHEAREAGVPVISDESLAELHLDDPARPPSLALDDPGTHVLAAGSLSKPVWGGLRTGWLRADPELIRRLALARGSQDVGSPVLDQLLAAVVLPRLDELLGGRRALLRERRDALIAAIGRARPKWRVSPPAGGMALWVELPPTTPASALAARAADHGVRLAPGPRFAVAGGFEQRLRLPFTQPPERLEEAVRRIADAEDALGPRAAPAEAPARWVA